MQLAARTEEGRRVAGARRSSTLALAMEVLEQVARAPGGVTANELARVLGAPRATVYRVVNSLVEDEFLLRRPDLHGFALGARVVELAHLVAEPGPSPRELIMQSLRDDTGETHHLALLGDDGLMLADEDPRRPVSDPVVFAADAARSAAGHLWLAELPAPDRRRVTPASVADINDIVAAVAARGFGQQIGLLAPDRACIAVPVRDAAGALTGALALSTSVARISTAVRHLAAMRAAAAALGGHALAE